MTNCNKGIEQLFTQRPCGLFSAPCYECEINDEVWQVIRQVSKIYTDIILTEPPALQSFSHFQMDTAQAKRFHPSAPSGVDGEPEIGYPWAGGRHNLANVPYFYFGLIAGSTAMDKLRKDYLVKP